MSALQDLNDAVSALADDVSTEIAALAAAISAASGTPDAAVEASVAKLKELSVALKASVAPTPTV